ncbi:uncharacterized protein LOC128250541 isoform X3 [Octopus bimaculoides]|uniref:uncharacterized protein LOC128250541 isoform X3 n=1 Tax=Octopus bimaculoides TaxID=37653 RepID=UPI0022E58B57|nr:uncharacterized protein LOC128250541 isoform X3 [Octopus bimaculoides]
MRNDNIMAIIEYRLFDNQSCCSSEVYHQESSRCVMKGISVLLFCAFISYSFSDEQNVTSVHRQTTANVSLNNMTHSGKCKRTLCSMYECNRYLTDKNCCPGVNCHCNLPQRICMCSSQNIIYGTHNSILQSIIALPIFLVNLHLIDVLFL